MRNLITEIPLWMRGNIINFVATMLGCTNNIEYGHCPALQQKACQNAVRCCHQARQRRGAALACCEQRHAC